MRAVWVAVCVMVLAGPAHAAKSCDELKAEIEAKIQGHGVKQFTLEVVPAGEASGKKVVGSCEAGSKQIVYERGS
ncbi:MAG: DUF1161 domain-containing protein [Uliginosibacterium sp.]|jgi:hypothetical protein|nr:DUF1161 domain-containing protein [Uliginosibacterium sp.]MBK9394729.1 DUF1161 domain-containing protein [Uliginosibacterium sp.]MBK9616220.1 DUF1161 domain-containing protein [Uliginosibacterium sp.]